jgi:hypothetical protein
MIVAGVGTVMTTIGAVESSCLRRIYRISGVSDLKHTANARLSPGPWPGPGSPQWQPKGQLPTYWTIRV